MECILTGQPLPERAPGRPGAPKRYFNAKASRCNHRLSEVETLLMELQADPGFTASAAASARARVFRIGNMVKVSAREVPVGKTVPFGIRLPQPLIEWVDAQPGSSRSATVAGLLADLAGL